MEQYTPQERMLIEKYDLVFLTKQERLMIARETDLETQAKIVQSYRADLERWGEMEKSYKNFNKF